MQIAQSGFHASNCLCCNSRELTREWAVLSAFFARRALLDEPRPVGLLRCRQCRTRYFDLAVSDEAISRLYADYRGPSYFHQRHQLEPWYTQAANDSIGNETSFGARRAVLASALAECGITPQFDAVLDHGGDRGQMLQDLRSPRKAVYEISGVETAPGVSAIDHTTMTASRWDLILSCHVLEHLPDPKHYVEQLVQLGHADTVYFFEVPDEHFASFSANATDWQRRWVSWLAGHPRGLQAFDFLSSAMRIKLRLVPPGFFVALREHLIFFSTAGLTRLLQDSGLKVLSARRRASGHIAVIAVKVADT
jgi:hypothetical protein